MGANSRFDRCSNASIVLSGLAGVGLATNEIMADLAQDSNRASTKYPYRTSGDYAIAMSEDR